MIETNNKEGETTNKEEIETTNNEEIGEHGVNYQDNKDDNPIQFPDLELGNDYAFPEGKIASDYNDDGKIKCEENLWNLLPVPLYLQF